MLRSAPADWMGLRTFPAFGSGFLGNPRKRQLSRNCVFLCCRNSKSFDLFLSFVCETGRAGAVYHTMIERKRKRDDFRAFVFLPVWNQFAMRGADEKRAD